MDCMKYGDIIDKDFQNLSISFDKSISELVLISYESINAFFLLFYEV